MTDDEPVFGSELRPGRAGGRAATADRRRSLFHRHDPDVVALARREAIVARKVFNPMGPGPNNSGMSRSHIVQAVEDSLRRKPA
jgi:hypothetical protein